MCFVAHRIVFFRVLHGCFFEPGLFMYVFFEPSFQVFLVGPAPASKKSTRRTLVPVRERIPVRDRIGCGTEINLSR